MLNSLDWRGNPRLPRRTRLERKAGTWIAGNARVIRSKRKNSVKWNLELSLYQITFICLL